jgi:hypothetical protein
MQIDQAHILGFAGGAATLVRSAGLACVAEINATACMQNHRMHDLMVAPAAMFVHNVGIACVWEINAAAGQLMWHLCGITNAPLTAGAGMHMNHYTCA